MEKNHLGTKSKKRFIKPVFLSCIFAAAIFSASCSDSSKKSDTGSNIYSDSKNEADRASQNNVSESNPIVQCKNMNEAQEIVGFDLKLPEKIEGYDDIKILAIQGDMIEVVYHKGDHEIIIRKGVSDNSTDGDISGDYSKYTNVGDANVGTTKVTFKGDDEKDPKLAIWTIDDFAYSLSSDELERADFNRIISDIK